MNKSRLINTSITVLLLVASLLSDKCFADTGKSKVLSMLKVNPIVVAAVTQAKEGSGAKSCAYEITSTELKQYEKGTAYDYDATITCRFKDALYSSMGIVHVTGTYLVSTGKRQALELSIAFAG